jgi:hypothetical protein
MTLPSIGSRRRLGWRARKHTAGGAQNRGSSHGVGPENLGSSHGGGGGHELLTMRHRRDAGPPQDRALYSCDCGRVFHAPVSTTVGCPECGSTQAW